MVYAGLLLSSALGWGQEAPPPPIVSGKETTDFPAVVSLLLDDPQSGNMAHFCSGTIIHERWILTAAHCLTDLNLYQQYGATVWVAVGYNVELEEGITELVEAASWEAHAGFSMQVLKDDIGLVELIDPLSPTPVRLSEVAPDDAWVGTALTYVGWGVTSDYGQDSGVKRMAEIPFDRADDQFIYSYDDGGQNVCYGDSGGASLRSEDGLWFIAGINSHVYPVQGNTGCVGGGSGATRVDQYLDWIAERVPLEENAYGPPPGLSNYIEDDGEEDAGKGCSQVPLQVGFLPLLLGVAVTFGRRR